MRRFFKAVYNKLGFHSSALIGVLIVVSIVMQIRSPYFLTLANIEVTLTGFILEAIMAVGMTMVIIAGGIDLSVSSVLPFSAVVVALLMTAGVPVGAAVAITLLLATVVGIINATLKTVLNVHPFIATLAMMLTIRGVAVVLSGGENISGFPEAFAVLGQGRFLGVAISIWAFAALALIFGLLLHHHRFFQQIYFVGYDPRAARVSGINVTLVNYVVFGLSSLLAGFAGIVAASQFGAAHNSFAFGAELKVIAAVVIGGTNIVRGGRGTMFGTVLGVLFMAIVFNAFAMSGINTYWQEIVNGVMLLLAIFMVQAVQSREGRSAVG